MRSRKWRDANPPRDVVETILARDDSWRFRRLDGVASTQTLRADGSVVDTEGYDTATHTVFMGLPPMTPLPAKLSRRTPNRRFGCFKACWRNSLSSTKRDGLWRWRRW